MIKVVAIAVWRLELDRQSTEINQELSKKQLKLKIAHESFLVPQHNDIIKLVEAQ